MIKNNNIDEIEKEVTKSNQVVNNLKLMTIAAGVVGGAYLLGTVKGIQLGKTLGRLEGYSQATSDIANIVKEAKEKVDK